ncbi:MAG: hypothetical protein M3014_03230, partial [Chloroflexota bacterium]|nr:hypothetical protein [Chloroflexota bacterium]
MPIHLQELSILSWLWHDAGLRDFHLEWLKSGDVAASVRCEINPQEDRQPLLALGISTPIVEIQFRDVWMLRANVMGYNAQSEVVTSWDHVQPSALIKELQDSGYAGNSDLIHHQVRCSGGSIFDI